MVKMTARGVFDPKGRRKYLTETEGRRFLAHASELTELERRFCETIFFSGCRISEALGIVGMDVDVETCAVVIHTLKKRRGPENRLIPVPEVLAKGLKALAHESPEKRLWPFCRTTGWRLIKRVMKAAGITGLQACPKGLRHGFGVRGTMKQIPLHIIRDWMGHSYSSTTEIYLAVKGEEERSLIQRTW